MMTEKSLLEMLSKSEVSVYEYIRDKSELGGGSMKEPFSKIAEALNVSNATVHRAVKKLRQQAIIGVVSSEDKTEASELIFYGIPEPEKQVGDIFNMIQSLSESSKRFENILQAKDKQVEEMSHENALLKERINELEQELRRGAPFDPERIISSQSLDDGTTAYIVRDAYKH